MDERIADFEPDLIVENRLDQHDENLEALTRAIEYLLESPEDSIQKRKIGFEVRDE